MRTRRGLVQAAALEIDRVGYEGARLSRICASASVSMGALTFHFSSKAALADAIQEEGRAIARALVSRVAESREPTLRAVAELTVGLTRMLEESVVARSTARLARERPEEPDRWTQVWLPVVQDLLERAREDGRPWVTAHPEAVTALVRYLLTGAEVQIRGAGAPMTGAGAGKVADQVEGIWRLVLAGTEAEGG
ncbi:TetR/AcrR family transcriptional regulator [Streptomyces ossamyceticus]|uniref:TetR/AcrR family transcriptional regulator n=1 Tax=Streptomyces ossamyceticus TaxID=249581 RepID=A0ABV2UY06_9ACTN